jgi:hypothetical protein
MGHERYASVDDIRDDRPVDVLARRLFDSGGVTQVHANGSVITVHLAPGWTGEKLLDVIRGLYVHYQPGSSNGDTAAPAASPDTAASDSSSDTPTDTAAPDTAASDTPASDTRAS